MYGIVTVWNCDHDLKGENVRLRPDGPIFLAYICDFGMASGTQASTMRTTKTSTAAATLMYKAPELFDGEFCAASEVYAFAITVWEALTGQIPWEGALEAQIMMAVCLKKERPPLAAAAAATRLGQLAQRCWVQDPSSRPSFRDAGKEL